MNRSAGAERFWDGEFNPGTRLSSPLYSSEIFSMNLNVNDDQFVDAPSIDLVRQSIDELSTEEFVVLARGEHQYIQVFYNPDRTFQLEYRAGSELEHYETVEPPSIDDVEQAFIRYADGMANWQTPWNWQKLNLDG